MVIDPGPGEYCTVRIRNVEPHVALLFKKFIFAKYCVLIYVSCSIMFYLITKIIRFIYEPGLKVRGLHRPMGMAISNFLSIGLGMGGRAIVNGYTSINFNGISVHRSLSGTSISISFLHFLSDMTHYT